MASSAAGDAPSREKRIDLDNIDSLLQLERAAGHSVALCHGVFDLLHPGHFRHFTSAASLADVLVVTITGDKFVSKGPGRPAFTQDLRAEALAGLQVIDYVIVVEDSTATPAITAVRPDYFVKGREYANEEEDPTGNIRTERELVERLGGQIAFTDDIVFSSSKLINTFLPRHSDTTQKWISDFGSRHDPADVITWLDRITGLRVMVTGDAILDIYTTCEALGKASKEPVLCFNKGTSVVHGGGSLAIAGHCAGLGAQVTLVTAINSRDEDGEELQRLRDGGVHTRTVHLDPRSTVRKERLVDLQTQTRVLELYEMDDSPLNADVERRLIEVLNAAMDQVDSVVVADYGHGLLSDDAIETICKRSNFLAVNAQTNAGNHGFNSLGKYPRADFATLNGNEARLEVRRRHLDFQSYMPELRASLRAESLLVTQGAMGIDVYGADGQVTNAPALAPFVTDRVGAGDAVLSVTALLTRVGAPPDVVAFVGNLAGAWAVSFLGNENHLNIGDLKRQITATLK